MTSYGKIGPLVKQLFDTLQKEANHVLSSDGLTMVQVHLLVKLKSSPEKCCSLKELEKELHIAQSTVVGIVKRLEQKKLVESHGDVADKRIKKVRITAKGAEISKKAIQHLDEVEKKFFSGITAAEKEELIELLEKVVQTFN